MKLIQGIALALSIIGAVNWGLIGLFGFNLVTFLFGKGLLEAFVYIAVGIAGIFSLTIYMQLNEH